MSTPDTPPASPEPAEKKSRAGRDLPAAIASGVVLLVVIAASLYFWKPAFVVVVIAAILIGIWELKKGFAVKGIRVSQEPLMVGAVVMLVGAYVAGAPALVTALAVTALATMLWRLRGGVDGFVRDATATVFTAVYVPFLAGFVALLLAEDDGALGVVTFVLVTIASDIGGYAVGVLAGKHPMAPVISPKKSWEGFAGSTISCVLAGWATVVYLLDGAWWVGVLLGLITVVMATLGDLCESVIKRDLGIKDMSAVIPGHGGLMDRLDSLLATVAPTWLLLHYLVF
ncbi:MAG TPA: phosphatidate cytidylyltransferase [Nocardioidaceae bacterium]|nr:phosphatidate cytidylyltransferase [Nocardioidaceae bacterium]